MFKQIDIDALVAHPDAPSRMSQSMTKKLSNNIAKIDHYKPVIVRPLCENRYQILDGRVRVEVLRSLGRKKIACDVWNIDNDAARLFVAACGSVKGTSVPELRMSLLFDLLERFSPVELGALLPESEAQLTNLLTLCSEESEKHHANPGIPSTQEHQEVTMTLRMSKSQYAAIKTILHDFMQESQIHDMGEALAHYLLEKAS
jgi:ParB-like chromosome segregation protein Spo0J